MDYPYTVILVDAVELPPAARIQAEARFAQALEGDLGGPDEVAAVLRAWQAANDPALSDIDDQTAAVAVQWPRAADKATEAALGSIGHLAGLHFEVNLG